MKPTFSSVYRSSLTALLFFFITFLWWGSALSRTHVAGIGGDPFQTLWRFIRLSTVFPGMLLEESLLPNGAPLPWMPFLLFGGEVIAYNIAWFLSAFLAGFCTYALARSWKAQWLPAFLAGILVEFAPYRVAESLGHFGALQLWWIPCTLLALSWWFHTKKIPALVASIFVLIGTAYTDHQLFLFCSFFLALFVLFFSRAFFHHIRTAPLHVLFLLLVVSAALTPFYGRVLLTAFAPDSILVLGKSEQERFSLSPKMLLTPPPFSLIRQGITGYGNDTTTLADHTGSLGVFLFLSVLLLFISSRKRTRTMWLLALMGVSGIVFALGPSLLLFGHHIPLPATFLHLLPGFSALRTVNRFLTLSVLAFPLLFALLVSKLSLRLPLLIAWGALLLLEIFPARGFPSMPVPSSALTQNTEQSSGLLSLPAYTNERFASEQLYLSARNPRPLLANSALLRATGDTIPQTFGGVPLLGDLIFLRIADFSLPTFFGQSLPEVAPLVLSAYNVGTILLDTHPPGGFLQEQGSRAVLPQEGIDTIHSFLRDTLLLPEHELDNHTFVYTVPPSSSNGVLAIRGEGWKLLFRSSTLLKTLLAKSATFTLYARHVPQSVLFSARVVSSPVCPFLRLSGGGEEILATPDTNGMIGIPFHLSADGFTRYTLDVGGTSCVLENPQIYILP